VIPSELNSLAERLFKILGHADFLAMKGLANEAPIFLQPYDATQEDALRRMVESLAGRLRNRGVSVLTQDLFELVMEELEETGLLADLLAHEAEWERIDVLETLQNLSDPPRLIKRLARVMDAAEPQLTLITGPGRVFPFLRTHSVLESLQPAMLHRPVVIFFPGEYTQDADGSHLKLFGSVPSPRITNPYYRATNLDHYRL
jgi:hypothetical protein